MTNKTQYQFSTTLPDWSEWPHAQEEGTFVVLFSKISKEKIMTQLATLQLRAMVWRAMMNKKPATCKIVQDMMEYAIALQEKEDCSLTRWLFGDSSALTIQVWQIPLSLWRGALNAVIESAYAYTRRSDWHASHCRAFWKELASSCEMCVWGWPAQEIKRFNEEGDEEANWLEGEGAEVVPF